MLLGEVVTSKEVKQSTLTHLLLIKEQIFKGTVDPQILSFKCVKFIKVAQYINHWLFLITRGYELQLTQVARLYGGKENIHMF